MIWLRLPDRLIGRVIAEAQWLVLPLILLRPLRDIVHCCSLQANEEIERRMREMPPPPPPPPDFDQK